MSKKQQQPKFKTVATVGTVKRRGFVSRRAARRIARAEWENHNPTVHQHARESRQGCGTWLVFFKKR
jgi:hypothetical protein